MHYLYFFLECIMYAIVIGLHYHVFSKYRYNSVFEERIERLKKTPRWQDAVFLCVIGTSALVVFFIWQKLYPTQPHHMGYFLAFFAGTIMMLAFERRWIRHVDLMLCLPSMVIVWLFLLAFETLILTYQAGWIYTDSTVFTIHLSSHIGIILENLIFFYIFSPFVAILVFTRLAYKRSDITAFFLTNLIFGVTGAIWEYVCIAVFNLYVIVLDRSVLPVNLFGAKTSLEEMLYYIPFSAISILVYLMLYYRKYRFHPAVAVHGRRRQCVELQSTI